jgi:hypothetical protein
MKMNPSQKGAVAELAIASEAAKAGIPVLRPMAEGGRYDLVFEIGERFLRIQCKWANRKGNVIAAHIGTCRLTPRGYVRTTYAPDEIDAIAIYCHELDECYLVPVEDVRGQTYVHLRLAPAANNQEAAIRYAAQYQLRGAIAQLGERCHGMAEVVGSSPTSSTPREAA